MWLQPLSRVTITANAGAGRLNGEETLVVEEQGLLKVRGSAHMRRGLNKASNDENTIR